MGPGLFRAGPRARRAPRIPSTVRWSGQETTISCMTTNEKLPDLAGASDWGSQWGSLGQLFQKAESTADHVARLERRLEKLRAIPDRKARVRATDFGSSQRNIARHAANGVGPLNSTAEAAHDEREPFLEMC